MLLFPIMRSLTNLFRTANRTTASQPKRRPHWRPSSCRRPRRPRRPELPHPPALAAPTGLTATADDAQVHLSWAAPPSNGEPVSGYKVYLDRNPGVRANTAVGNPTGTAGTVANLVSAARRTLDTPGSTELMNMIGHEVTLDQKPSVSVLVDGQQVATLRLGLSIVFDVDALLLGISAGRLTAVHSGRCEITVTLAVQGTDLAVRHAHLELPGVIPIRHGIRLLPTGDYPAGNNPADDHLTETGTGKQS